MVIAQCGESFIPVYDGVARVMEAYSRIQCQRGHEVCVITPQYPTGWRGNFPYEIIDYAALRFTKKWPYKLGIAQLDKHFIDRIKNIDFDIVHVHGPGTAGVIGREIARKRKIPLIGTFHTKFYDDVLAFTNSKTLAKIGSKMVAKFYDSCDEIWAVSENAAETLRSYGAKKEIKIMPNGTDHRILQKDKIPEIRQKYGIREDIPVRLFVGRITFEKNIKRILESCSILKGWGIDFQLVMAGQGPDFDAVVALSKKLGIDDKVNMLGFIDSTITLDCLYSIADLFIFPSIFDNSPLVVREAAAMSTPSLVIEGSSAAEPISDMVNGLLTTDNADYIAEKIKEYFDLTAEKRFEIGECAKNGISQPWDGPIMDDVIERYQLLIERYRNRTK